MRRNVALILLSVVLLAVLAAAVFWLYSRQPGSASGPQVQALQVANPALDARFSYDPQVFTPAEYDATADYPLRLAADGFVLVGKRIRGLGDMLGKDPGAMLYDFVGVMNIRELEQGYRLAMVGEPHHEDVRIAGQLGLWQQLTYQRRENGKWPGYFPEYARPEDPQVPVYLEGWAVFSAHDLYFYQAISASQLGEGQRQACLDVLDSVEYGAVLGGTQPEVAE